MLRSTEPRERPGPRIPAPGLGVPCREAQADGLPCSQLRADCADCDRAQPAEMNATDKKPIPTATYA